MQNTLALGGLNEMGVPSGNATLQLALTQRLLSQTKPPGSLGVLESLGLRLGLLQGTLSPSVERARICVFAGSHGVACAGVSAFPSEVTPQMVANFLAGGAAVCVLARAAGAELHVVDVGVEGANPDWKQTATFFARSQGPGTHSFLETRAMSSDACDGALAAGREQVQLALKEGIQVIGIGEMGIGNTTAAAALCAALLPAPPDAITGRGTGVDDAGLARKRAAVRTALELHATPLTGSHAARHWLESVGGFEIAAMTGCILAAAEARLPIVVDGFIASAAALVAARLEPAALEVCFFAHQSAESGHALVLHALGATPLLSLGMRLGEASGAALALPLLKAAARLLCEMATFESAGVHSGAGEPHAL